MERKTCHIAGANRGISKATAVGLVKRRATVIMLCRHQERGKLAGVEIREASGNPAIGSLTADLTAQASILQFAADFQGHYQHLHVLINNAGVAKKKRTLYDMDKAYNQSKLANIVFTYELARRLE